MRTGLLWRRSGWAVYRDAGHNDLRLVKERTGHSYYGGLYGGHIAFDFPERIPAFVKARVRKLLVFGK